MYSDITLTNHLQTSSSITTKSKIVAEWNLNNSETIQAIGNYKNRPLSASLDANTAPNTTWNPNENEATKEANQWYGYTDYDTVIDGGYTDEGEVPVTFRLSKDRQKSLMSLEDCFKRFRPRSGINKFRFYGKGKSLIPVSSFGSTFLNPRYYAASKDDNFKYWSSYRTEGNTEYGISGVVSGNDKLIHDAAPFVIYKNLIPTNKVVMKIQTNVGPNNSFRANATTYRITSASGNGTSVTYTSSSLESTQPFQVGTSVTIGVGLTPLGYSNVTGIISAVGGSQGAWTFSIPGNATTGTSGGNAVVSFNEDPFFFGSSQNYKSTPLVWKIQKYTGNPNDIQPWVDIYTTSSDVFTEDGYFQLSYGITNTQILNTYKNNFVLLGTLSNTSSLPLIKDVKAKGQAYLVKTNDTDKGTLYIYNGGVSDTAISNYDAIVPTYGWYKSEESITNSQLFITELDKTKAPKFIENSITTYREFEYIKGLRVVVTSMLNTNTIFDLIELSPRLETDITDMTTNFSIKKFASDVGVSSLPASQLLASTGQISIFDSNEVFNKNNLNSLLNIDSSITLINKNLQLKFYEIVSNVPQEFGIFAKSPSPTGTTNISIPTENPHGIVQNDTVLVTGVSPSGYNGVWTAQSGTSASTLVLNIGSNPGTITKSGTVVKTSASYKDFYIPIKTMYSDGFPQYSDTDRQVDIQLRDLSFYFESFLAPEILLRNASLSFIVATLLDSIGYSNYKFLMTSTTIEPVIPYFMVAPNTNIMQVLQDLAVATQSTMFFDEVNNFVVMSKEYLLPKTSDRSKDIDLYGFDNDARKTNILDINSESDEIYNDGKIIHYNRYIQKAANDLQNLSSLEKNQVWEYERVMFWSLEAQEQNTQSKNEQDETQEAFTLAAIPLSLTLNNQPPSVENGEIKNNVIEFGDGVYWLVRYSGYFYSNGEIIKYDAVEYSVGIDDSTYTIWITSNEEYQYYFSQINKGKKMYKTGKVRIYTEPEYNESGNIVGILKHGREQFGTKIAEHRVDVSSNTKDSWWEKSKKSRPTSYYNIFNSTNTDSKIAKDSISNLEPITQTTIKNFLGTQTYSSKNKRILYKENIQSSGLVLTGPSFGQDINALATISSVTKQIDDNADTYGARLRFYGDDENNPNYKKLFSSYPAYDFGKDIKFNNPDGTYIPGPSKVGAQSGGIAIMTNDKGEGYYYEILSLDYVNTNVLKNQAGLNTLFFYKMVLQDGLLKPTVLYEDFRNFLPDTGKFVAKTNNTREDTVYDLGVSVSKNSNSWTFSLYLDNEQIALFTDNSPIKDKVKQNVSLFVRGSSKILYENVFAMRRYLTNNEMTIKVPTNLTNQQKQETAYVLGYFPNSTQVFNDVTISGVPASKYGLSPLVQTGFLSKLSTSSIPENEIWYEEFGAIMRECSYFNVKFDKAYPALTSLINPVPAFLGGYRIAGYTSTPYRAEFLVFNVTDGPLDIGSNKGYQDSLSITGVTFTESVARELTVDEFLTGKSSYGEKPGYNAFKYKSDYTNIKNNRLLYGTKSFVVDSPYIQTEDLANNLMSFLIKRISKPRKAVGVSVFGMPIIQMGDLVGFSYDTSKTLPNTVTGNNFVVYASEYSRDSSGPSTRLYLSEVLQ